MIPALRRFQFGICFRLTAWSTRNYRITIFVLSFTWDTLHALRGLTFLENPHKRGALWAAENRFPGYFHLFPQCAGLAQKSLNIVWNLRICRWLFWKLGEFLTQMEMPFNATPSLRFPSINSTTGCKMVHLWNCTHHGLNYLPVILTQPSWVLVPFSLKIENLIIQESIRFQRTYDTSMSL